MKIKYTREQLLALNTQACKQRPINLPNLAFTKSPTIATLFNNRPTTCKPYTEKNTRFDDDIGSAGISMPVC